VATAKARRPLCVVIAGPNGAGKTTFARRYLSSIVKIDNFVNADLIAAGLSPLAPSSAAVRAGRVVLQEIDRLARARESFAFESTLSGRAYERRDSSASNASGIELKSCSSA
jgi:predicted ABC-type ATPase